MKNVIQRFKYQIQADLYDLFDKKAEKNPISLLNQYIREAEKQTEETGKLLARQGQLKKELEEQVTQASFMLEKREAQLKLANATEEQDLIDFATEEVASYSARKTAILSTIEASKNEYFVLERKFETMKHKIKDMKVRQLQLMGKENVTRAHHQMDKVIEANINANNNFDKISDYIDGLAESIDRKYEETTFEARLVQLEKEQAVVVAK